ncbi:unnamed protein product [Arctogadus glacialis]
MVTMCPQNLVSRESPASEPDGSREPTGLLGPMSRLASDPSTTSGELEKEVLLSPSPRGGLTGVLLVLPGPPERRCWDRADPGANGGLNRYDPALGEPGGLTKGGGANSGKGVGLTQGQPLWKSALASRVQG